MSIFLEGPAQVPTAWERAIDVLKGKDNPFECLARPQRADERFGTFHIPELHQKERVQLLEMIDSYRLAEYHESDDLKPSRVVTVRGDRGSGKTHLLQSLVARQDGKPQVVVRPAFFEPQLALEEYLLTQLKTALCEEDEFHADRPLDVISRALTRRLMRQALLAAGPTDRLFALRPAGVGGFSLLWGGGERLLRRLDGLPARLADAEEFGDLPARLADYGLQPEQAYRLIHGHLRASEIGADPLVAIRRMLYDAMARSVLLRDNDALPAFLSGGYQDVEGGGIRSDLVSRLLRILIEACALVRMPAVFAFDNLERLLSPKGEAEGDISHTFVETLAQAVDSTSGVLFLLFAEASLFAQRLLPLLSGDTYARWRLEQGVPVAGRGPVHLVDLKEPSADDMRCLMQARVRPLLVGQQGAEELPTEFPFSLAFLQDLRGSGSANLRAMLYRLRDEYSRLVYGKLPDDDKIPPPISPPESTEWPKLLESAWNRGLSAARRKLQDSASHHDVQGCLGALLRAALPLNLDEWALHAVEDVLAVGENPEYGVVSQLDWRVQEGQSQAKGPHSLKVGVGFLLAAGPGMAHDLRAKFDFLRERQRGARLVILWPTQHDGDHLVEHLPPGTRKAWDDEAEQHWRTELRRIEDIDVRRILAFYQLLDRVEEAAQQPPPAGAVRDFLHQRVGRFFSLFRPPHNKTAERVAADED